MGSCQSGQQWLVVARTAQWYPQPGDRTGRVPHGKQRLGEEEGVAVRELKGNGEETQER